ncbi:MAG: pyrroline-5-carboxylate reductase [Verrucomicrobiota bacterium]
MAKLVFLGAGRMASAMISGLLRQSIMQPSDIACTCGDDDTGEKLAAQTGISFSRNLADLLVDAETLVLACKPQQLSQLDNALAALTADKLIVSILAGTRIEKLNTRFPDARNIVRAMPNTPGQIGLGATAFCEQSPLDRDDLLSTKRILGALGEVLIELPEVQLDAVTALSGSGPAYVFEFTKALEEAGVSLGLERKTAAQLARQTVIGASALMAANDEDPETLRNHVTSPGGTTQAALESFQAGDLHGIVQQALQAARNRSIELSEH